MVAHIPHHIAGQSIFTKGNVLQVFNPGYGETIAEVHCAELPIIRQAIEAAKVAQASWAKTPPLKRAKIIRRFLTHIEEHENQLAEIVSTEHGKTIADAKASIQRGIEIIAYHAGIQSQLQGAFSHHVSQDIHAYTLYQPLGICAGVAPFNFPVMIPLWMMIPAIACGNAFILKPSEKTPSASLQLVKWFEECGLPPGIAQCIQGNAQTVQILLEQREIQAITAVGSTAAAQHIYREAARYGKRVHTFGGAKNHALIMPDADLEHAADAIVSAAFGSAGQRCMALSTIMTVDEKTSQQLLKLLSPKIKAIRLGTFKDPDIDMGPVISTQQVQHLEQMLEKGLQEGAQLFIDGRTFSKPNSTGFFIGPSLFTKVRPQMEIYQKELFGPILIHLQMKSMKEAVQTINQHPYGNGAVIFTQNGHDADLFVDQIQAGMVGINIPIPVPIVSHPFGGWKQSSFGSHPMHGMDSVHFYTRHKSITQTWPKDISKFSFNMPHL